MQRNAQGWEKVGEYRRDRTSESMKANSKGIDFIAGLSYGSFPFFFFFFSLTKSQTTWSEVHRGLHERNKSARLRRVSGGRRVRR